MVRSVMMKGEERVDAGKQDQPRAQDRPTHGLSERHRIEGGTGAAEGGGVSAEPER